MKKTSRREQYKKHERYIESEKLDSLFDWQENKEYSPGTFINTELGERVPFPPHIEDLVRLHKLIRLREPSVILEFGVGYSTVVMADALFKNGKGRIFSVDASEKWILYVKKHFPAPLLDYVEFRHSEVRAATFNGQLCHYYTELPDVIPNFIYLDAPSPKDVHGKINGLTFQDSDRTVVGADLLLMEPTFLPGTLIVVDGRTNNARFLARNFKRDYDIKRDRKGDVTTLELLGQGDLFGLDFGQSSSFITKWQRIFVTRLYSSRMISRLKK